MANPLFQIGQIWEQSIGDFGRILRIFTFKEPMLQDPTQQSKTLLSRPFRPYSALCASLAVLCVATSAFAKPPHRHHSHHVNPPAPPPPAQVVLRDPLKDGGDAAHSFAKKLRLEAGADVLPTCFLSARRAAKDRELYLLLAMQQVEGGYDAVNLYDRGIISWGLMQWSAHENSLQEVLWHIKQRLLQQRRGRVWAALFKEHGLDIQRGADGEPAFFVGGPTAWQSVTGIENLRILFRGTRTVGKFDSPTAVRWARVFARAGRNETVQELQNEWAVRRLRQCLREHVDGKWRVCDFSRNDLFSDALTFALWTNNPAACREHFRRAVRLARLVTGEPDPAKWPQNLFPFLWEQVGRGSNFGAWQSRTESVARMVPVGSPGRRGAYIQLAARGWRLDTSRQGLAAKGRLWKIEVPKPVVPQLLEKRVAPRFAVPASLQSGYPSVLSILNLGVPTLTPAKPIQPLPLAPIVPTEPVIVPKTKSL